jgi:phosphate transport system protein
MEAVHRDLLCMCAEVEELVHRAVQALDAGEHDAIDRLIARDDDVDRWDVRIEEEALRILALHKPVAIDLRRVAAVLRISRDLERVADLGVNIAERAAGLKSGPEIAVPEELESMARIALEMLHQSIDALVELDSRRAREVCLRDDEVDNLGQKIVDGLADLIKRSPDLVEPAMHLFSASRQVERVADHATNIAEDVVYLIEGEIVRHRPEPPG